MSGDANPLVRSECSGTIQHSSRVGDKAGLGAVPSGMPLISPLDEAFRVTSQAYDIIIIGTGAGGGTLAYRLAPSGKRVLLLERGDFLPRERENWDATSVFVDAMDGLRVEMGPAEISFGADQNTTERDGRKGHLSDTVGDEPAVLMLVQFEEPPSPAMPCPFR